MVNSERYIEEIKKLQKEILNKDIICDEKDKEIKRLREALGRLNVRILKVSKELDILYGTPSDKITNLHNLSELINLIKEALPYLKTNYIKYSHSNVNSDILFNLIKNLESKILVHEQNSN